MPAPDSIEARLAARRDAARAARATAPTWGPEQSVPVEQVQPGDYLVVVPTQRGLQGRRYGAQVAEVLAVHPGMLIEGPMGTRLKAGGYGTVLVPRVVGGATRGMAVWPQGHVATVRRPQ